jgi:DNA transformation protein
MGELSKLPNIAEKVEKQLNEVGIETVEQLEKCGSKQAWLKIKEIDDSACINRLCALEGAIQRIRWHNLSEQTKNDLKEFYNASKW